MSGFQEWNFLSTRRQYPDRTRFNLLSIPGYLYALWKLGMRVIIPGPDSRYELGTADHQASHRKLASP